MTFNFHNYSHSPLFENSSHLSSFNTNQLFSIITTSTATTTTSTAPTKTTSSKNLGYL
ncbi:hypothetical protein HanXRQr2_Chr16g0777021 [Helianthus annuus]|uniref:Uncharacterized protein n=1 Tax=Helianthus annuus TaxID=4232 RepID=A0A251S3M0_HELAN|nr:hypothetical protein HanXRQr2_Chr16g0777021 [Helianthus annuus]